VEGVVLEVVDPVEDDVARPVVQEIDVRDRRTADDPLDLVGGVDDVADGLRRRFRLELAVARPSI